MPLTSPPKSLVFHVEELQPPGHSISESGTSETANDSGLLRFPASPLSANEILFLPRAVRDNNETADRVRRGLHFEKQLTPVECFRLYPRAIGWSLLLFLTVVMEAYGKCLMSGLFAFPEFKQRFGQPVQPTASGGREQEYEISPLWQMGLQNASVAFEIVGLLAHGYVTDIIGYRKMMMLCISWMILSIFPAVFAQNTEMLLASQAILGLSWGVIQTLGATYAAEVVPSTLRAHVLSNANMCWVLGQLVGIGVLRTRVDEDSEWSYRLPLALQWAWAVPLLIGVYFAPNSPWWLIRHGRHSDARRALRRLSDNTNLDIEDTLEVMKHINQAEAQLTGAKTSYAALFRGANLRRTEIASVVWACQALGGSALTGYAPYFLVRAGFPPYRAFDISIAMYGLAILGGMGAWGLLAAVGRRKLYLAGLASATTICGVAGLISVFVQQEASRNWALGALIIASTFTYNLTIGPVCYVIVAEVPSTRLRVKTVALARVVYNIFTLINNVLAPQMLNPTAWDLQGKAIFVYAGTALVCLIWAWCRLPETQKLSYFELDILFENAAPTRRFKMVQDRLNDVGYLSVRRAEQMRNAWHGWLAYS